MKRIPPDTCLYCTHTDERSPPADGARGGDAWPAVDIRLGVQETLHGYARERPVGPYIANFERAPQKSANGVTVG